MLEAILLAVVSALRPAGLAAMYALLSTSMPRRRLVVYVGVGFIWSFAVGVLVVAALQGVEVQTGASTATAVVELGLGAAAAGFAAGIASGRFLVRPAGRSSGTSRISRALRDPSLAMAAGAAVATHLPGIFYLLGLNAITATDPALPRAVADVLIFDAIWLSIPAAALVVALRRPDLARELLERGNAWARRHERQIATVVFAAVGAYFAIKGAAELLS